MPRKRPPEIHELLYKFVLRKFSFEVAIRMYIQNHVQVLRQNHLHRRIQIAQVLRVQIVSVIGLPKRLRVHAQSHMIESHSLDQREIFRRRPTLKMLLGVALWIGHLREPFAQIDPAPQMFRPPSRQRRVHALRHRPPPSQQNQHPRQQGKSPRHHHTHAQLFPHCASQTLSSRPESGCRSVSVGVEQCSTPSRKRLCLGKI